MLIVANYPRYNRNMYYYLVSPAKLIRQDQHSFAYASEHTLSVGSLVIIEVGKSNLTGVVLSRIEKPDFTVKNILATLDYKPIPEPLIKTALWMSDHYSTHLAIVWQTILPRGLTKKRRSKQQILNSTPVKNRIKNVFTSEQAEAITTIQQMPTNTALLHGKTGSGKTLVYIELIKQAYRSGLSSIVLVPEIALTTQLVDEFSKYFSNIVLTHSKQTEAERHRTWEKVLSSTEPQVIIGPRSALFMPIKKLGFIVVDECHEPSFKQEQSPRYSALRASSILAKHHQAKLILGSATPNVSDYFLAQKTGSPIITMKKMARPGAVKPTIDLIDMTKRNNFTKHHFLSDKLLAAISDTLEHYRQALVFHNRRGSASITFCENCKWNAGCPRCFIPLTLHADSYSLICRICNYRSKVPTTCPQCHNADILHKGIGTKTVEAELAKLFPNKKIARFDGDTDNDNTADKLYGELKNGNIDIIIGTQVIAKGFDLPYLRTVGVIQADAGLALPDFLAPERTFQLLAQVIGRVGRSSHKTKVIVQTYQPDHISIKCGLEQNYDEFYSQTIRHRQAANFPPFVHLLKLTCSYKTEASAIKNSQKLIKKLKELAPEHTYFLGPTPAFYERLRDSYRWQIIVKSHNRQNLVGLVPAIPAKNWQFELDPISIL